MIKSNIAEEFDAFSKNYTEDMVSCVPHYMILLDFFTKNLPDHFEPQTVLDLGCGNGNITNSLLELFPKAKYTLVDASQDMIDLCQSRFNLFNVNYVNSYFNDFKFEAHRFDLIVAGFSLHHCARDDKPILYKNIHKALKPDGIFSCSDLMLNKDDMEHTKHLKDWEAFVSKSFPDGEKWSWLEEHYKQFDNPNSINNHLHWLKEAGFNHFSFNTYDKFWTHFKAFKS